MSLRRTVRIDAIRRHWAILTVIAAAAALIFTGLGRNHLWADEGDTAVLARSILAYGVPTAWDGVTFTDSDLGQRLTDDFVMVSHPWLQYYVTAASLALLGETAFAARAPFAASGLLTVALVYVLVLRFNGDRRTAASASLLLALSVQFLIFATQSRHYALHAALTCLLILQFTRLTSLKQGLLFAVVAVLLFHTHPAAVAPLAALGLLTLVHQPFAHLRRWFWLSMPIVALFTGPWFLVARQGYAENTTLLPDAGSLGARLAQFGIECASVTPLAGMLVLLLVTRRQGRATAPVPPGRDVRRHADRAGERSLVLVLLSITATYAVLMALSQSRETMWVVGIRQTPAILPFAAMLGALAIRRTSRGRGPAWLVLLFVVAGTRLAELPPWTFWQTPTASFDSRAPVTFHVPARLVDRVFKTEWLGYLTSLVRDDPGTVARVSEFLRERARPGDILITNYEWEPLYFHTNLPQGLKILPSYPIYEAARARGLPSYVSSADGVRWIVWRRTWGAYRGQACDQVIKALTDAQIRVEQVATMTETVWENRENLHFRRFPGGRYIYPWFQNVPDTLVFRVEWPAR